MECNQFFIIEALLITLIYVTVSQVALFSQGGDGGI